MLHEILLSLSGVPSPIWEDLKHSRPLTIDDDHVSLGSLTSPAEKAMVEVVAELADLHIKVREATSLICTSHPSPICRAISSRVKSHHLQRFVDKIIEVETSVLDQDATYVGAYNIVPLSTIVSSFNPWLRPLRWLWKTTQHLQDGSTGAAALHHLRSETYTGYSDIKEIAEHLLVVGHRAWLQNLMPWVLYGKTPSFGATDFMIQLKSSPTAYHLQSELNPYFVTSDTAETILAIGLALQQINPNSGTTSTCNSLMPDSLRRLQTCNLPLQENEFSKVIDSINETISQTALSVILPTSTIVDFLHVLQGFVLLRNGEFSTCLIQQAEKHLSSRQVSSTTTKPVRKLGRLDELNVNEAETATILEKTWSDLAAFVSEKDSDNQLRENAVHILRLATSRLPLPISMLLPNGAALIVQLLPGSPLSIFIASADIQLYQKLGAYLVSLRRAEFQLTKLWREPTHRRCRPSPLGPPLSATGRGRQGLNICRQRDDRRHCSMRSHWASVSQILFFVSELDSYFHGEVLSNSWEQLLTWLDLDTHRPPSSKTSSRPTTSSSFKRPTSSYSNEFSPSTSNHKQRSTHRKDPRTIALAHRKYLEALSQNLLLNNPEYVSLLHNLLTSTDHYVALFYRLQTIWRDLDLQQDESITNAFTNLSKDENDTFTEMKRTNATVTSTIQTLISQIRDTEKQRHVPDLTTGIAQVHISRSTGETGTLISASSPPFEPWRAKTLDRLLMKIDSLAGDDTSDKFEDALVDFE